MKDEASAGENFKMIWLPGGIRVTAKYSRQTDQNG